MLYQVITCLIIFVVVVLLVMVLRKNKKQNDERFRMPRPISAGRKGRRHVSFNPTVLVVPDREQVPLGKDFV